MKQKYALFHGNIKRILFLSSLLLFYCRDDSLQTCTQFKYDSSTGKCHDCNGKVGFNTLDFIEIRKTKNAECLALHKLEMLLLLRDTTNSPHFGYSTLDAYNFKGSVFDSCQLFFNYIKRADLRGTDLSTLQYGYAVVTGRKDGFTRLPVAGSTTVTGDSVYCVR